VTIDKAKAKKVKQSVSLDKTLKKQRFLAVILFILVLVGFIILCMFGLYAWAWVTTMSSL
jgi:hypothetical protein